MIQCIIVVEADIIILWRLILASVVVSRRVSLSFLVVSVPNVWTRKSLPRVNHIGQVQTIAPNEPNGSRRSIYGAIREDAASTHLNGMKMDDQMLLRTLSHESITRRSLREKLTSYPIRFKS